MEAYTHLTNVHAVRLSSPTTTAFRQIIYGRLKIL